MAAEESRKEDPSSASPSASASSSSSSSSSSGVQFDFNFEPEHRLQRFAKNFELAMKKFYQNTLIEVIEGLDTLFIYARNLLQNLGDHRFSTISIQNFHFQERLGSLIGSEECLRAIGFDPDASGWYYKFDYKTFSSEEGYTCLADAKDEILQRLDVLRRQFDALPVRLSPEHCYSSVVAAGSHHERGHRPTMEDDEMTVDSFLDRPGYGFFALYDGHGGRETVEFVVKVMQMNLAQVLVQNPGVHLNEAMMRAYELTDAQLRRQNILKSGTTAVTCVVKPAEDDFEEADSPMVSDDEDEDDSDFDGLDFYRSPRQRLGGEEQEKQEQQRQGKGGEKDTKSGGGGGGGGVDGEEEAPRHPAMVKKRMLYVSNVGDSRAILCRGRRAVRLTIDHKASLLDEGERVMEAGGFVSRKRVNGILAISRALGDHILKERSEVVSCIPYCTVTALNPKLDKYLILACDGVWDVMSDQQAVDFVLDHVEEYRRQRMDPLGGPERLQEQDLITYQKIMNEILAETSKQLVHQALDKGSTDNVTVICIQLNWD